MPTELEKRLNVDVDPETHRGIKLLSVSKGIPMGSLLKEWVLKGYQESQQETCPVSACGASFLADGPRRG